MSDGNVRLYLQYYMGRTNVYDEAKGKMVSKVVIRKEKLDLILIGKPRTTEERERNRETMEVAKRVRFEREQQFKEQREGYRLHSERKVSFFDVFDKYIDEYKLKDVKMMRTARKRFLAFLEGSHKYRLLADVITVDQLSRDMMADFASYLEERSVGEGARTLFQRFKKFVKWMYEHDMIRTNPCNGVTITVDNSCFKKNILSEDEVRTLLSTHYGRESVLIRTAFIYSLYTGARQCDVRELQYKNIDRSNMLVTFEQNKTSGHSRCSMVTVPLSENLLAMIDALRDNPSPEDKVFPLPSTTMCSKALRRWCEHAGITKRITWHCARHTFATLMLRSNANIKVVQELLGHSSLTYTERYTHAISEDKKRAVLSLPEIPT